MTDVEKFKLHRRKYMGRYNKTPKAKAYRKKHRPKGKEYAKIYYQALRELLRRHKKEFMIIKEEVRNGRHSI